MEKIRMTTPLVEMDGDEMTRILWKMIKDELLLLRTSQTGCDPLTFQYVIPG